MRFGFVTCVQLGLSCMEAIASVGGKLDLAITLEEDMARSKAGRVYLDDFCAAQAVPLLKVRNVNSEEAIDAVLAAALDWLFIIGWSQIARAPLLRAPVRGAIGMHPTLLPEGRGRAAIPWAILKGLDATGVTMFKLDEGTDTGPILAQRRIALSPESTATELYAAVDRAHIELMKEVFPKLRAGTETLIEQDHGRATEWPGRNAEDGAIDLAGSVFEAERLVRAVTRPYPGAFVDLAEGRLIIWRAEIDREGTTGDGPHVVFSDGVLVPREWEWAAPDGSSRVA